jgi:hypothetical protein
MPARRDLRKGIGKRDVRIRGLGTGIPLQAQFIVPNKNKVRRTIVRIKY